MNDNNIHHYTTLKQLHIKDTDVIDVTIQYIYIGMKIKVLLTVIY